jgi:hypothetical protein
MNYIGLVLKSKRMSASGKPRTCMHASIHTMIGTYKIGKAKLIMGS